MGLWQSAMGILQSSADDIILYAFLIFVLILVGIDKMIKDFKRGASSRPKLHIEDRTDLTNYTFAFNSDITTHRNETKVSISTKLIIGVLVLSIIFTPLYELITTLEPVTRFYYFNCLI